MRTLKFLLRKEFLQIFRNKLILRMIFIMPVLQLIILPFAANYEMKNILLSIVDRDHSEYSRKLINKFTSSGYFKLTNLSSSYADALNVIEEDKADLIIDIPQNFEKDLLRDSQSKIMISANAINGQTAGLAVSYSNTIIREFNNEIRTEWIQQPRLNSQPVIEITSSNWFNPRMNYKYFIVPGVLALLVTLVGFILTSLNIVKEKETGTIEQLNVSPIKKYQFILGKLIPFWILGMVVLIIGFAVSFVIYGIFPQGSFLIGFSFAGIYLIAILGFGLLTSTFAETQQQAMFIAYFFMMIFVLLGGLFAPIENMPDWAKYLTYINPVSYLIEVMRMIVLKGSGFADLAKHFGIITMFAVVLNVLAILNYKKTT
ncbi:MAG: ABC transporter permease [Stygiobacter sp. RIFOXYC12_FULL_38_8]|nr:MAG: ABC transporter permease [Stygiobacter sp. GWC2_38_9]OGU84421.1 MAG: ABC transporter permease [Stygiobacter sp. RIFOXYA12_FULL_38_9]OGV07729.1 MAG: ABC transporter permease [Stygiobacter sp. RIFOXYB2_FULL_37_11]OGV12732.1 MAG: ABC transporter permease [Stygiobacter sp. RIFOXYC2_FULL_38_25]OGV17616.1 MAG: ABC transporter permease [Stygiobacter sp. RIFOXYA2_FULL_38_8]OGV26990.1 MAG: ABC transporter permease [Stygiobacter sp. RIFOXYC12_FULL_38_8]OGV82011.1 MAG: ABC transporter permease [